MHVWARLQLSFCFCSPQTYMQADKQFFSNVLWRVHFAHSAYCTFKSVFLKFETCVLFFLLNGSAATFCCYLCAEHLLILGCLKFERIISQYEHKTQKKTVFCPCSLKIEMPFLPDRSNVICRNGRHKRAEYISDYFTGFCLCFIFFTSQLTDSYDFQMGEQERAWERKINWIQKISITLMNAPCWDS